MTNYYLLKSGHREFFPYWNQEDIVSVGWSEAAEMVYEGKPEEEIRAVLDNQYGQGVGYALGVLNCFVGQEGGSRPPMSAGDIVIVIGQRHIRGNSVIRGVAEVGEIQKWDTPVEDDFGHLLYRDVNKWLYNDGPVARKELSEKFQMSGSASTHLPSTLQQWNPEDTTHSAVQELVDQLDAAPSIHPKTYDFEFSERVIQEHIADHPDEFQADTEIVPGKVEQEYQTENGGFADFVFLSDSDGITVVETKIDTAGPAAARQLRRYIDDIQNEHEETVRGKLVAEDFYDHDTIQSEIEDHDITLHRYQVTLEYEAVSLD